MGRTSVFFSFFNSKNPTKLTQLMRTFPAATCYCPFQNQVKRVALLFFHFVSSYINHQYFLLGNLFFKFLLSVHSVNQNCLNFSKFSLLWQFSLLDVGGDSSSFFCKNLSFLEHCVMGYLFGRSAPIFKLFQGTCSEGASQVFTFFSYWLRLWASLAIMESYLGLGGHR